MITIKIDTLVSIMKIWVKPNEGTLQWSGVCRQVGRGRQCRKPFVRSRKIAPVSLPFSEAVNTSLVDFSRAVVVEKCLIFPHRKLKLCPGLGFFCVGARQISIKKVLKKPPLCLGVQPTDGRSTAWDTRGVLVLTVGEESEVSRK